MTTTTSTETDTFPLGLTVEVWTGGEEHGWDEDRGRPEYISPEVIVTGEVVEIHDMRYGDRMIVVEGQDAETGDDFKIWVWANAIHRVVTPLDEVPDTAADFPSDQVEEDTERGGIDFEEPLCHHGLSEWLCADPIGHYPRDGAW